VAEPLLTILVPTLYSREHYFSRLYSRLLPQTASGDVVIMRLVDDGDETIGRKRHRLVESARTPYVCFIDDDDDVPDDYGAVMCDAIRRGADVVGFHLRQTMDGVLSCYAVHSVDAEKWKPHTADGIRVHRRTPNHLNPVRREMALAVGFRSWNFGEDADYAKRLRRAFPTMREVFIDRVMYEYLYRTDRSGERVNTEQH